MVELISLTCPNCTATMQIEKSRKVAYCTYCGTKMLVNNTNEKIVHHIDHAAMAKIDAELEIEMQKMRMVADERRRKEEAQKREETASNILAVPFLILFLWFLWQIISTYFL